MRVIFLCFFFLVTYVAAMASSALSENHSPGVIRLGFTAKVINIADRNDAATAIKAWVSTVAKEQGLNDRIEVKYMETTEEADSSFRLDQIDAGTMTSQELHSLSFQPASVYLTLREEDPMIHYALLVRKDGASSLEQLEPRNITIFRGQEMSLAKMWVSGLFAESPSSEFKTTHPLDFPQEKDVSQAIFKVFFGQIDAAVVPVDSFMLAAELNPQLAKELHILRQSEPLIPGLFVFRPSWSGPSSDALVAAITELHKSSSGQQVLTVFQCSSIKKYPVAILKETYAFIERHEAQGSLP
jgi:hypothetical protein